MYEKKKTISNMIVADNNCARARGIRARRNDGKAVIFVAQPEKSVIETQL